MDAATELAHIRQENEKLRAENADLGRRLELLGVNCEDLKRQLEWFHRQLFGSKSEKRIEIPPEQMTFWDQLGLEDPKEPEEPEFETVKRRKRGKKRFEGAVNESGLRFGPDVPVETIPIDNPEAAAIPESERELVGEKVVHKLAQITCDYRILRYVARSWKRRDTGEFIAAAPPPAVLDRTCADVSFLAGMMVDKFCWHLPLHRQHQRLEAAGIQVSRSSLTNWMLRSASLLAPVCDAQFRSILESKVIAMDETPIRAGRTGPGKMRTAWFWPVFGDRDEIAFPFRLSRGNAAVPDLLGDFEGTLVSDGNQAYAAYAASRNGAVTHASCWAHARRQFEKAKDSEPRLGAEALELIGGLYACEGRIREKKLKGREKLEFRRSRALPVANAFWKWCHRHYEDPRHLPKSPIVKALNYALNRRSQLEAWLSDPEVPIDTNHLERGLRVLPLGRKNWLFCWTEVGAEAVGTVQSLIATCRLQGVDPRAYLEDVLQRVSVHPSRRVEDLTPRRWKDLFADDPMASDLGTGVQCRASDLTGAG